MLSATEILQLYVYSNDLGTVPDSVLAKASEMYVQSVQKQLLEHRTDNNIRLRPSLLGKAAIDVVARKFYPSLYQDGVTSPRFWQLLHDGDVFEADYYIGLCARDIPVLETQVECDWYGIKGHSDMVVSLGGKTVLLELKTSNKGYFDSILKMQSSEGRRFRYGVEYEDVECLAARMTDFRGHITQAAIYGEAAKVDEIVIIVKCKDTSELLLYNLTEKDKKSSIVRARNIANAWNECQSWEEVFYYCGIPQPNKELQARNHTGRHLVPPKLYGSPIIPLLYEWATDKDKVVICGYRMPEESYENISPKLRSQYEEIDIYTYSNEDVRELLEEWQYFQSNRRR